MTLRVSIGTVGVSAREAGEVGVMTASVMTVSVSVEARSSAALRSPTAVIIQDRRTPADQATSTRLAMPSATSRTAMRTGQETSRKVGGGALGTLDRTPASRDKAEISHAGPRPDQCLRCKGDALSPRTPVPVAKSRSTDTSCLCLITRP